MGEASAVRTVLPAHCLEILAVIREAGGMVCTGSCHQQKKEQLHCRQIGKVLDIGFATVWDRVNHLLQQGLLEAAEGEVPRRLRVTPAGEAVLAAGPGKEPV